MASAKPFEEVRERPREKVKALISFEALLGNQEDVAEALVGSATPAQRKSLLADFIAYHQKCLVSAVPIDSVALSNLTRFIKSYGFLLDYDLAVAKLVEVASYYENTEDIESAVLLAEDALTFAEATSNKALHRKAYSRLGACYSRQFDFERSCICYGNALRLATALGDPLYEFAVLSNVVTLLDAMGLTREASRLARRIMDLCPQGSEDLDLLHLQNAINGFKFAAELNDFDGMASFHAVASRKMRKVSQVPEIWRAYFEANSTTFLIRQDKLPEARRRICRRAKTAAAKSNSRVAVVILSASVDCAISMSDWSWLKELEESLQSVLFLSKAYPPDYELMLGLLAQVYDHIECGSNRRLSYVYARRLQEHIVSVRHRQFFGKLSSTDGLDNGVAPVLSNPDYDVVLPTAELGRSINLVDLSLVSNVHRSDESFGDSEGKFLKSRVSSEERGLRTLDYCIAENWAVAAEFGDEGDGAHCFLVGALAHKLSAALGFDYDQCLKIELACRLHDVGKIGVAGAPLHKTSGTDWHGSIYLREHSAAGERLLQSSSDPVLILASRIARAHHEWWNGFGFPDSLSGESIPIEARICAVASEYSALVGTKKPDQAWSHQEATGQIATMAGIQFDPQVVEAFLTCQGLEDSAENNKRTAEKLGVNSLKKAKAHLDACVSLID